MKRENKKKCFRKGMLHLTKRENGTKKKKKDGLDRKRDNWKENRLGSIGRWGGGGRRLRRTRERRESMGPVCVLHLFSIFLLRDFSPSAILLELAPSSYPRRETRPSP